MNTEKPVGFFIWNSFQLFQIMSIARHLQGAEILINLRDKQDVNALFSKKLLQSIDVPIRYIDATYFRNDCPDHHAIVCQSPFKNMEHCRQTILIGMQYSMAKERHQYGSWRALCDLNLVYGPYSKDKISKFSPCVEVGNPRFDDWFIPDGTFQSSSKRSENKKQTLLYLPTWSKTSSIDLFASHILALSDHYEVLIKTHHLTNIFEKKKSNKLNPSQKLSHEDELLNLMASADVVLSDYSGAIFDAILLKKPIILLQPHSDSLDKTDRFSTQSIEVKRRTEIGIVVKTPDQLLSAVQDTLSGKQDYTNANAKLRSECFSFTCDCGKRAAQAIAEFLTTDLVRPQSQIKLRDEVRQERINKSKPNLFKFLKRTFLGWE